MLTIAPVLTGKCFCGTVQYAVADEFSYAVYCHCSNCRRATGSAFKAIAGIPTQKLSLTHGASQIMTFVSEDGSWTSDHCSRCGSLLYANVREGTFAHIAMGTLVDTPSIRPTCHVFVGSKAPWFTITDDLPQFETHALN